MDKTFREIMFGAQEKYERAIKGAITREEARRWGALEAPLSYSAALARLTKDELTVIRTNYSISGASSLKKQLLIDLLAQRLPSVLPELLNKLDAERYGILKKIAARKDGVTASIENLDLEYFQNRGLLFTGSYEGKQVAMMPQEAAEIIRAADSPAYRATLRTNTEWIQLTRGMLHYYGVLSYQELLHQLQQLTGNQVDLGHYLYLMEEAQDYYMEIESIPRGLSYYEVWDPDRVREEQQIRDGVPFYPFAKSQLLKAADPDYIDRDSHYLALVDFILSHYDISRQMTDTLVFEIVFAIRNGEMPADVLTYLQKHLEIDEFELIEGFMDRIVSLYNHTNQWFIKGYAPRELSAARQAAVVPLFQEPAGPKRGADVIHIGTRQKIGRNDPCPCGSGEKFKKCCGKS